MTRFAIDLPTALRLLEENVTVPTQHSLVGPNLLRSQALSELYRSVRSGGRSPAAGRELLDRLAALKIRLLGDRVSRAVAWQVADQLGWDDTPNAEYLAVAKLQSDAFVALDPTLRAAADGIVPLADFADLTR
jgi:predicted nucleic acid-binding protein